MEIEDESENDDSTQDFSMLGYLSQMFSSQYKYLTSSANDVDHLVADIDPDRLGFSIPADYQGEVLKLWIYIMQPNLDGVVAQ